MPDDPTNFYWAAMDPNYREPWWRRALAWRPRFMRGQWVQMGYISDEEDPA